MKSKYCHECNEQQEMAEVTDGTNSLFQCLKCGTIQTEKGTIISTEETIMQSTWVQREDATYEEFNHRIF